MLWDRFGITFGLLPVATNNVSGLESLKTEAFSTNSRMWLGNFSTKLETLWGRCGRDDFEIYFVFQLNVA